MSIYETHLMKDPSLPFIFHKSIGAAAHRMGALNWHENVEIIRFLAGEGIMIYDALRLPVKAGEIAVINSNHLHSFESGEGLRYHCLIVDRSFCMSNYIDTSTIQFEKLFCDEEIKERIDHLAEEYDALGEPYRVPSIRASALNIMTLLCKRHSLPLDEREEDGHTMACVRKAIGYIRAGYQRDLPLDEVADFVGLSKFYFAREFRRVTGYTFVTYVNLTRCEAAKGLLQEGQMSIGKIANVCGFSGLSYFTRTFLRYVGMLPSEYRERYERTSVGKL